MSFRFRLFKIVYFIIITMFTIFTVSCSENINSYDENNVEFIDSLNRKVSIKKSPNRVVALLGSFADVWYLSGGSVCATVSDAWTDFDLPLENCVNLGGAHSPSLELIVKSNPDLVLASSSTKSNVEMKDSLEMMGITVAYFDVDNFGDYLNMLNICTDITGRKDLYQKNGLEIKDKIEEIKNDFNKLGLSDNEKSVLLLRTSSSFVKAKGSSGTILGEMLKDLGCINIADSDNSLLENLSLECVIKNEPNYIFVVTMGSDTEAAYNSINKMFEENPAWKSLKAYKEERFFIMDKSLFNIKPNARWALAYEVLYDKLK